MNLRRTGPIFVCGNEQRSLQKKLSTRNKLVALIMNSAALIKKERQDDLRRATRTVAMRAEKCTEVDGWIFEHLL